MSKPQHILIIRLSALGDVAMTVPVVRALRNQHPDLKISVLSKPFHQALFENIENVNFMPIETKSKHKGLIGLWQLYTELKTQKLTHIADFHNVLRSKILTAYFTLDQVEIAKIDKGRKEKKELVCNIKKPAKIIKSTFERYQAVLESLNFKVDLGQPIFPQKQTQILSQLDIQQEKKLIGFAPFAHYETKTYPVDLSRKFLEFCKSKTWKILLFGSKDEIPKLERLAQDLAHVKIVAGQFDFKQELVLMTNLDLMISMDSANAHLAAMQGVKVITLWGNTHPMLGFSPFNQPKNYALTADATKYPLIPTSVFGNKTVTGYDDVMRTIAPDTIVELANKILNQS